MLLVLLVLTVLQVIMRMVMMEVEKSIAFQMSQASTHHYTQVLNSLCEKIT
jgi:hypothetical protein